MRLTKKQTFFYQDAFMKKHNSLRCFFLILLAFVLIIFSFENHVYSESESGSNVGYKSIAIDTTSDRVLAAKEDEGGIDVIDIKTGDITNTILLNKEIEAIVIDEQRRILAVAEGEKAIHIISLDTFNTISDISLKEEPKSLAIGTELGILLIADEEDKVMAIDLNTYQKIKEIKVSKKPV